MNVPTQKSKPTAPPLRFAGFMGEWEAKRLGDFLKEHKELVPASTNLPVYTSSRTGLRPQNEYYDNRELQNDGSYGVVPRNYFTYRHMSDDLTFKFNINNYEDNIVVSKEYPVFKSVGLDSKFLLTKLNEGNDFKKFAIMQKKGGTRTRLYFKDLKNWHTNLPSLQEQQKISDFLEAIDFQIENFRNQKEQLELYKKGMMQRLFSQQLRFRDKNGKFYPDWKQKNLESIVDCLDNERVPVNSSERQSRIGKYPYYGANGIQGYINEFIFDEDLVLIAEDGGNFDNYGTQPIAQLISGRTWVNNHAHVLKAKDNLITTNYLFYSLVHRDIRKYIVGGGRAKLNKSSLLSIVISTPTIEEQQKIANFLTSIDKVIELMQKQIEATVLWKKALMQRMFV